MRYDTPIQFVSDGSKVYDPDTGTWNQSGTIRVKRMANVTHTSAQRQQAVFGDVKATRYTVRLQRPYTAKYTFIQIGTNKYYPEMERLPADTESITVVKHG